ncbi:MAG: asparagine synthase C-terminal domain-containing protein [Candidatus Micrarchaeota archaeon]|nr:asparagine synthase C-terminal domain-containing protein [Candidatus Micrarchaeota archaeon]
MADIKKLAALFTEGVKNTCQGEVAILFSGGLDSATIATVAKMFTSAPLLVTAGIEGSADLISARKIAAELNLPHKEVILTEEEIIQVYKKCYKIRNGDMLKVELMVPVFSCCREAARAGKWRILSGSGAEELFIGYDRYFKKKGKVLEKQLAKEIKELPNGDCGSQELVAKNFGMHAGWPFLYPPFLNEVLSLPLKDRLGTRESKKPLLRAIAAELGVPQDAIDRRKKAMQYGSGVHKILVKNIRAIEEELRMKAELKERKQAAFAATRARFTANRHKRK